MENFYSIQMLKLKCIWKLHTHHRYSCWSRFSWIVWIK